MSVGRGCEADELQLASSGTCRPLSTVVLIPPDSPRPSLSAYDCDGAAAEAPDVPLLRSSQPTLNSTSTTAALLQAGSGDGRLTLPCTPAQLLQLQQYSPFSSTQSSLQPACRICQCSSSADVLLDGSGRASGAAAVATSKHVLISPCRCTGSLQYVHPKCLRKWIEVCQRRKCSDSSNGRSSQRKLDSCELCGYVFRKRTTIKVKGWRFPSVGAHDKCLHSTFVVCVAAMLASVVAMVMFFAGNREQLASGGSPHYYLPLDGTGRLSRDEVASLASGVTFFASFFVAMVVEMKAKRTIYQILRRCVHHNTVWVIENYSERHDVQPGGHGGGGGAGGCTRNS